MREPSPPTDEQDPAERLRTRIAELERERDALRDEASLYRSIVDSAEDLLFELNLDGVFAYVSPSCVAQLGYTDGELVGSHFGRFVHPDDIPSCEALLAQALASGKRQTHVEHRVCRRDGVWRWFRSSAALILDASGAPIAFAGVSSDITDRKESEATQRVSEDTFKRLYTSMSEGLALHELLYDAAGKPYDYRLLDVNPAFESILGLRASEVRDRTATEVYKCSSPPFLDIYAQVAETGAPTRFEATLEGTAKSFDVSAFSPRRGQFATVFEDITEHKRIEQALRASEARFRTLIEGAPDAIFVQSAGRFVYMNATALALFGAPSPEAILGTPLIDRIAPDDQEAVRARIATSGEAGQSPLLTEIDIVRFDGSRVPTETTLVPIRFLGREAHLAFLRDISSRRNAQAEREQLLAAIDQSGEVIVITDSTGVIQYVNPAFERITGYTRAEAVGQTPRVLKSGVHAPSFYSDLWQTILSGQTWRGRFTNRRKDGTHYIEDASISPVRDGSGRIVNFVAVKRDVTERLRLETQLQQAHKMESVGRLAGGIAHDFNNMLSVILGNVELVIGAPGQPCLADLLEIRRAAERSTDLTRQLLTFARKQTVAPKVLDLNDAVANTLKMLRRLIGENIELVWHPTAARTTVRIDPSQLDQVLTNLSVNARDAIGEVGRLTIETGRMHIADNADNADGASAGASPGDYVTLTFSDNGCGMDAATLEHIFEPFFTTKREGEGTGLGLATVYGIVRQNGGSIGVRSGVMDGTTFTILLPFESQAIQDLGEAEGHQSSGGHHETILLVEDEGAILRLGKRTLERLGYRVFTAGTPNEAIRWADEHQGAIDLLITDVVLPEMSGYELAKRILAGSQNLKVILMSGYTANAFDQADLVKSGALFLPKPFTLKALTSKVSDALSNSRLFQ